jgi:lysophospholipase L1-like esterase
MITSIMVILILALVEGGVRLRQWIKYGSGEHLEQVFEVQGDTGLRVAKANYSTRTMQINSLGFRGPEITEPKPAGVFRLGFLGGSTTFCREVSSNENVWAHQVWEQLQARYPDIQMDYVNGGVSGYTTETSLQNLKMRVAPLEPDLIVIYHASNDMTQETRRLARKEGLIAKPEGNSWLANYSVFWFLVEKNLQIWQAQEKVKEGTERLTKLPDEFAQWFEERLVTLIKEAQKTARLVAVVTWTQQLREEHSPEVNLKAASSSLFFMPYMTPDTLLEGFGRYNDAIRRAAARTGALLVEKAGMIPGDSIHFVDAVHFSDAGSRIMAERVGKRILESRRFQDTMINWSSK